jgi:short-subunit dehydrogenase
MALPPPSADSTCLVTGASSGIGADIARELAKRGHGVTLVARRKERLTKLADELTSVHGVRAETLECDLSDDGSRTRMLALLAELGTRVEVLVNNAGYGSGGSFHELELEREIQMVRLNCEAVVALCGRFLPEMVERGRGAVLNVASVAGFQPVVRQATYGATKAFVLSFTEALHGELSGAGITATALCPGPVRTEFMDEAGIQEGAGIVPDFLWTNSSFVAEQGVTGLEKGRRVVVPGRANAVAAFSGQHAPRGALVRLSSRFYPVK